MWTDSISNEIICGTILVFAILMSIAAFYYGIILGLQSLMRKNWRGFILIFLGLYIIIFTGSFTSLCSRSLIAPT